MSATSFTKLPFAIHHFFFLTFKHTFKSFSLLRIISIRSFLLHGSCFQAAGIFSCLRRRSQHCYFRWFLESTVFGLLYLPAFFPAILFKGRSCWSSLTAAATRRPSSVTIRHHHYRPQLLPHHHRYDH